MYVCMYVYTFINYYVSYNLYPQIICKHILYNGIIFKVKERKNK